MIDLHCHLLPGIDDGPDTMAQAMELARMASDDGIQKALVTPHVHPGRWDNTKSSLLPVFNQFCTSLRDSGIPLEVRLGGEVRFSTEILKLFSDQEIPYLGGWNGKQVLLLEFPHSHMPQGSEQLVKWLLDRGVQPMIAHPERNKDVMRNLEKIYPLISLGCLVQVTAMSVTNQFGPAAHTRAHELLDRGWVTVIASDGHNVKNRPPLLSSAYEEVADRYGHGPAEDLFINNAEKMLSA